MTEEQRLRARSIAIDTAAWIAVIAVITGKLLALAFDFICDKVLPLARIIITHAVLAWQDYQVGRNEYLLTECASSRIIRGAYQSKPRGFKS